MSNNLHLWFHLYPDIIKPIGGVKQVHRVVESLSALGIEATIIQESSGFRPNWFSSNVKTISRNKWAYLNLNPSNNYAVFAETFLPAISTIAPKLPKIIYNQNSSYSFGLPSVKLYDPVDILARYQNPEISQVWCVSEYDKSTIVKFGVDPRKVFSIPNIIDVSPISNQSHKKKQIAYMPRKNTIDSQIVLALLKRQPWLKDWNFKEISNCSHNQVINILNESLVFLSFGHPEGFGLPVAEAMACRCFVIGYSGLGGRELFQLAQQYSLSICIEFGDRQEFVDAMSIFIARFEHNQHFLLTQLVRLSSHVLDIYSLSNQSKSLSSCTQILNS